MRWDHLFDDLESQLEHELGADEVDLFAEEERLRLGRLALRDRFRAMIDGADAEPLRLQLVDGTRLGLVIGAIGRDWIAGEHAGDGPTTPSCLIPIAAIAACFPDPQQAATSTRAAEPSGSPVGSLSARLGLGFVLRDLCRRRAPLQISTAREQIHGTIDRVARDHVDLAEHEPGVARREHAVRALRMLPLSQILLVRF